MLKLASIENRHSPRTEINQSEKAWIKIGGQKIPTTVHNYGFGGLGVVTESNLMQSPLHMEREVEITWRDQNFKGQIRHTRENEKNWYIGFRIDSPFEGKDVSFNDEDAGWDLIRDEKTVSELVSDLTFKGPEVLSEIHQISGSARAFVSEYVEAEQLLKFELFEFNRGKINQGKVKIQFDLFQTCHSFESSIVKIEGDNCWVEMPKVLARLLRRETVRVETKDIQKPIYVKFEDPVLGAFNEDEFEVMDVSEHGLAIAHKRKYFYLPVGYQIKGIKIKIGKSKWASGDGVVRTFRNDVENDRYVIGLYFEANKKSDRTLWHNLVLEARYPSLSFFYEEEDHQKIWDLFDRSDYLHLKGKEAYTHIINLTKNTWEKLSNAGTEISKRPLIRLGEEIVGHIQMDQIYPDTWCIHHLAIDPKISKLVAKEIYSVTTDILLSENGKHLINFTESSKPWNRRSYYDFVSNYRYQSHNELKTFNIHEVDIDSLVPPDIGEFRVANKFDMTRVKSFIENNLSSIERKACSLTDLDKDLYMKDFSSLMEKVELERGRNFLVAYKGGVLCGVAVLEYGTLGINIVGVLDMLYVYKVKDCDMKDEDLVKGFCFLAKEEYSKIGRNKFLLSTEEVVTLEDSLEGLTFVTEATRWIAKKEILPRYHAFSQLLYGHLLLRKEKLKSKKRGQKT